MTHRQIQNSFIIDLEGEKVGELLGTVFHIKNVKIESHDFDSDMSTIHNGVMFIEALIGSVLFSESDQTMEYNPLFYPNVPPIELTDEQREELEDTQNRADEVSSMLAANGQFAVPVTNIFDTMGDFISSRLTINNDGLKVVLRTAVPVDQYIHRVYEQRNDDEENKMKRTIGLIN